MARSGRIGHSRLAEEGELTVEHSGADGQCCEYDAGIAPHGLLRYLANPAAPVCTGDDNSLDVAADGGAAIKKPAPPEGGAGYAQWLFASVGLGRLAALS